MQFLSNDYSNNNSNNNNIINNKSSEKFSLDKFCFPKQNQEFLDKIFIGVKFLKKPKKNYTWCHC